MQGKLLICFSQHQIKIKKFMECYSSHRNSEVLRQIQVQFSQLNIQNKSKKNTNSILFRYNELYSPHRSFIYLLQTKVSRIYRISITYFYGFTCQLASFKANFSRFLCNNFSCLSNAEMMDKPTIPKSPNPSTRNNGAKLKPPAPNSQRGMNRSKSEQKFGSANVETPQKRVRLRDYLFVASTSAMRNNEKKQTLKSSISEKQILKESIYQLKKKKYELPNSQMYDIVKSQIIKDLKNCIEDLQGKVEALKAEDISNPSNEDLKYLYNIKRILGDSIRSALSEMGELNLKKNGNVIREIINMGLALKNDTIAEQQNEEESCATEKKDLPGNLIESLFFFGKNK